jgi:serine/threonine protein kinase
MNSCLKGSLNKYIFSPKESVVLSNKKIYDIAIRVVREIEYLHQGCDMQILHFDIKCHNILLDENFTPEVSDFGLAKLLLIDNNIVSVTAARGWTLGYIWLLNYSTKTLEVHVSNKSNIYSFEMLYVDGNGE